MQDRALLDEFSVLLSDESMTRLELFDSWLPGISTRLASTTQDIYAEFDSTIALVVFSHSLLADEKTDLRKRILNRNPYCQLALLLPRESFVSPYEDNYDACLQRPIFEDELQQTVETRLKYGIYSATLVEFYYLSAELAGTEHLQSDEEITAAVPEEVIYRHRQLKQRLAYLQSTLDIDDVHSIVQMVESRKHQLTEAEMNVDTAGTSKYHPERCPDCKLPWGVSHQNELGVGFERIGAYVWRCTRCNSLTHGLGASHRRVM